MNITAVEQDWIRENIQKIDFLKTLDEIQLNLLIETVKPRILAGNQPVIREGEASQAFFLIYNGKVSVWVERRDKRSRLSSLSRGDYFGEISLLTGKPATAHVIATTPTKVFFLDGPTFVAMVRQNQKLATHIINVMKKRLTERKTAIQALMNENLDEINQALKEFLTPPSPPNPPSPPATPS